MELTTDITEYGEGYPVKIHKEEDNDRIVVTAFNEGTYNSTSIDLLELLKYVKSNLPEIWESI